MTIATAQHEAGIAEFEGFLDVEDEVVGFPPEDADADAGRVIGVQARPRPLDPAAVDAVRAELESERHALAQAGEDVVDAVARFAIEWWEAAVEDVVVADPQRTLDVADRLTDLKIALLQLQSQALDLARLLVGPALPHTDGDEALRAFRSLLRGNQPSRVLEDPVRVLLGAIASPLAKAGLIDPGGSRDFVVSSNVWRFRFGVDLAPLHQHLAAYDARAERVQELMRRLDHLELELARGRAKALWDAA